MGTGNNARIIGKNLGISGISGLGYRNGILRNGSLNSVNWTGVLEWNTGLLEWNTGLLEWNTGMTYLEILGVARARARARQGQGQGARARQWQGHLVLVTPSSSRKSAAMLYHG